MSERDVRYCSTEDGVRIAYAVQGTGLPVVICPFFIESFAFDYLVPEVGEFLEELGHGRTLIRYDARGTGLSDRTLLFGQVPFLRDLSGVVDAAGIERFVIWASGTSGPGGSSTRRLTPIGYRTSSSSTRSRRPRRPWNRAPWKPWRPWPSRIGR